MNEDNIHLFLYFQQPLFRERDRHFTVFRNKRKCSCDSLVVFFKKLKQTGEHTIKYKVRHSLPSFLFQITVH